MTEIPFFDPQPLVAPLRSQLAAATKRVLDSGWYLLGPELEAFEAELAQHVGVAAAVGVANGTDAIELALRALDVGHGDEVIAPSHTAVPTICAIVRAGAVPVLVDIDPHTFCLCPHAAAAAVSPRTKAIVAVHLYGHPADVDALSRLAERHSLAFVEDCAQALGAKWQGRSVGSFGTLAACSFYPTKNLGALGDAGAVLTGDRALADRVRQLRQYGQPCRGWSVEHGMNSRLDELQAALLRVKLAYLADHQAMRTGLAQKYGQALASRRALTLPRVAAQTEHAWHLYVVRHPQRDALAQHLKQYGIGTMIHYLYAVHQQPAYAHLRRPELPLVETERAAAEALSLPLYVGLATERIDAIAAAVEQFTDRRSPSQVEP